MSKELLLSAGSLAVLSAHNTVTHPCPEYGCGDFSTRVRINKFFLEAFDNAIFGGSRNADGILREYNLGYIARWVWGRFPKNVDVNMRTLDIIGCMGISVEEFGRRYAQTRLYLDYGIIYKGPEEIKLRRIDDYIMRTQRTLQPSKEDPSKLVDHNGNEWFEYPYQYHFDHVVQVIRNEIVKARKERLVNRILTEERKKKGLT